MKKLEPVEDYVFAKREIPPDERDNGGILLLKDKYEKPNIATVVAIGPGKKNRKDVFIPTELQVGDKIVILNNGITAVSFEGQDLIMLREEDVLGIYEPQP